MEGKPRYVTDYLTDQSLAFIKENQQQPFFLFLSHYAVHTPIQAKQESVDHFNKKRAEDSQIRKQSGTNTRLNHTDAVYAGMLKDTDDSLGRIIAKLKELNLDQNTIIVFTSDNGGLSTGQRFIPPTANSPLRNGKGWAHEGGLRVPAIIKWPGKVKPGRISASPIVGSDFYPTLLEMNGLPLKPKQHLDGISLADHMLKNTKLPERSIYWYFPDQHGSGKTTKAAMLQGQNKLILYMNGERELFELKSDIGEKNNVLPQKTTLAESMTSRLQDWVSTPHETLKRSSR